MKLYCRNKINCGNKEICNDCRVKIYNEIPYKFEDLNDFKIFLNKNDCLILEKFKNKSNAKFIKFIYKEFIFIFYECQQCFKWYRINDHPFRLSYQIKENDDLKPTCSKQCMYLHRPKELYRNNGPKIKFCIKCNKDTLHNGNVCCICNPEADQHKTTDYFKLTLNRTKPGKCTKCGIFNNIRSVSGLGENICNCAFKQRQEMHFNRENFYKNKFNIISFESIDQEATLEDFDSLKGELGVWSRWTDENHGNYCLDVCKTKDIGGEMLSSLRSFNSLKENFNQELDTGWKKKYMNQAKDAGLFDDNCPGKIIFKLISYCDNEKDALIKEQQYAHDNKAKYWSLGPNETLFL